MEAAAKCGKSCFGGGNRKKNDIFLKNDLKNRKNGAILLNRDGEMVEWTKAPHWKCGVGQLTEGSNPSLSAIFMLKF